MRVVRQNENPCQSQTFRTYDELCLLPDQVTDNLVKLPLWKSNFDYITV